MEGRQKDLPKIARRVLARLKPGNVLALVGPLAAGKTTLTRELLSQMGYADKVTSPTFILKKHYSVRYRKFREVIHLDFFRLSSKELDSFDWKESLGQPGTLTIIEWPPRSLEDLPKKVKTITLEIVNNETRRFTFSKNFGD